MLRQETIIPTRLIFNNTVVVKELVMKNRLQEIRIAQGLTRDELAERVHTTGTTIYRLETGRRKLNDDWMRLLSAALQVPPEDIIAEPRLVPIVGTVGAGAEVFPIDDYPLVQPERLAEHVYPADGMEYAEAPPTGPLRDMVALRITGDSMHPIKEGWLVYYNNRIEGNCDQYLNELCVVKVRNGPVLVKELKRGYSIGRYNLFSHNAEIMEDRELEWCAKVQFLRPG